jgi:molecular chaperone DnaK (HSP70)
VTSYTLAIDFGTDFTLAVVRTGNGTPERVRFDGDDRMPSAVLLDEDGTLHAGPRVIDEAEFRPTAVEWTPKRLLGQGSVVLAGEIVEDVALVGAVIGHAAGAARNMFDGRAPEAVILTHPAVWTMARVARLEEAACRAELDRVQFVPEPVAAACALAERGRLDGVSIGALVALYDLGGGTFDTVLLERTGLTSFSPVGPPGGDDRLGGEDLDDLLIARLASTYLTDEERAYLCDPDGSPDPTAWHRARFELRCDTRRGKERLATRPVVRIKVHPLLGREYFELSRTQLEGIASELVHRTADLLLETLRRNGRKVDELAAICLAGGSSRLSLVKRLLGARFKRPIATHGDPKALTAEGALTAAERDASLPDEAHNVLRGALRAASSDVTSRKICLPPALAAELERMAEWGTLARRLGVDFNRPEELRAAVLAAHRRWGAFHLAAAPREAAVAEAMRIAYTAAFAELDDIQSHQRKEASR